MRSLVCGLALAVSSLFASDASATNFVVQNQAVCGHNFVQQQVVQRQFVQPVVQRQIVQRVVQPVKVQRVVQRQIVQPVKVQRVVQRQVQFVEAPHVQVQRVRSVVRPFALRSRLVGPSVSVRIR